MWHCMFYRVVWFYGALGIPLMSHPASCDALRMPPSSPPPFEVGFLGVLGGIHRASMPRYVPHVWRHFVRHHVGYDHPSHHSWESHPLPGAVLFRPGRGPSPHVPNRCDVGRSQHAAVRRVYNTPLAHSHELHSRYMSHGRRTPHLSMHATR